MWQRRLRLGLNNKKIKLKALAISVFGFVLLTLLLNLMNGQVQFSKKKEVNQVQFKTKKIKNKTRQKLQKKKIVKKQNHNKSLKPKMKMAFASSGLDLGIDILGLNAGDSKLLSQQGETVMTEDVVDRLPKIQYREEIVYPQQAKDKNIRGHVTVNILVSKQGTVEQVKLVDSSPQGVFEQVTLAAIKSWTFSPAEYKGQFVSVWVKQKLKFQVN